MNKKSKKDDLKNRGGWKVRHQQAAATNGANNQRYVF